MNNKGQTLIEVLVALTIGVLILTSIVTAVISALSNAQYTKNQTDANTYVQEAMDFIKSLRNTDYATFKNLSGNYCFASSCTSLNSTIGDPCGPKSVSCGQNIGVFVREIQVIQNSISCGQGGNENETDVKATVSWSDSKCTSSSNLYCHQVSAESCFSNFGIQPTP